MCKHPVNTKTSKWTRVPLIACKCLSVHYLVLKWVEVIVIEHFHTNSTRLIHRDCPCLYSTPTVWWSRSQWRSFLVARYLKTQHHQLHLPATPQTPPQARASFGAWLMLLHQSLSSLSSLLVSRPTLEPRAWHLSSRLEAPGIPSTLFLLDWWPKVGLRIFLYLGDPCVRLVLKLHLSTWTPSKVMDTGFPSLLQCLASCLVPWSHHRASESPHPKLQLCSPARAQHLHRWDLEADCYFSTISVNFQWSLSLSGSL